MSLAGYNQTTLAEASGVSRDTIWRVLHEKTDPNEDSLARLSKTLGRSLPTLVVEESLNPARTQRQLEEAAAERRRGVGDAASEPRVQAEDPFVIGARAMIETMRRQIEALVVLVGPDERTAAVREMLESMGRQVDALEILLLGSRGRAGAATLSELVQDLRRYGEEAQQVMTPPGEAPQRSVG